jgi:hypothetical protein
LKAYADASHTSLNAAILHLLEKAVGVDDRRKRLEERYSTWRESDFREFQQGLEAQRTVDADGRAVGDL